MLWIWKDQYLAISYFPSTNLAIFKCPCDNVTVLPPWPIIVKYAMMKLSMILPRSCWRWDDIQMISWSCRNLASLPCPGLPAALRDRGHLSIIGPPPLNPHVRPSGPTCDVCCLGQSWEKAKTRVLWLGLKIKDHPQVNYYWSPVIWSKMWCLLLKNTIVHKSSLLWHWMSISEIVIK